MENKEILANDVMETMEEIFIMENKEILANEVMETMEETLKTLGIIGTAKGDTLCYDSISGRYFTSDIDKLRRIENELNKRLMNEMYISLNELYYEMGLRCTEQGNELGFNIDDGFIDFNFSEQITDDNRPCIVVGYHIGPKTIPKKNNQDYIDN